MFVKTHLALDANFLDYGLSLYISYMYLFFILFFSEDITALPENIRKMINKNLGCHILPDFLSQGYFLLTPRFESYEELCLILCSLNFSY